MNDLTAETTLDAPHPAAVASLLAARHGDPFSLLGPHPAADGGVVVRVFLPMARQVEIVARDGGQMLAEAVRVHADGLFSAHIPAGTPYRLRIDGERVIDDTYAIPSTFGEVDIYLLAEGRHRRLGEVLGAHLLEWNGVAGTRFAVWAPNAQRVSVVGSFNDWDGRVNPMRHRIECGVWELFVPGVGVGALYKYELVGPGGNVLPLRADPCAWAAQKPPETASIVAALTPDWTDAEWMAGRAERHKPDAPLSVYEVHATSWLPGGEAATESWDALADRLLPYVSGMGFTHIELMPIMEHPFGGSWGYQPLGQFAPNSRLGPPEGFARFVDRAHRAGIGVILDWVPAHFPTDAHGLSYFDGTPLYEHSDPREGFHQDWNTAIYNLGRNEVRGFMLASALFWLQHYHVDGLRVDAVASMLYRDYSRKDGEWIPNIYGGRENLESIAFLQDLSRAVREDAPGALLIAEESTAFPGVTRSADEGGLGFDFKWNMGWMHDTLHYVEQEPIFRRWAHGEISFGLVYAFSEKFVLPLSHDEVVYGKGSMIEKMPGDLWQKFANLRAYYGFMWGHPGKKLLFMGGEFAQWKEWNHDTGLDWPLLDFGTHRGVQDLLADLNTLYRREPALHQRDTEGLGFTWIKLHDADASVFAWLRHGYDGAAPVLVVCNFTPVVREDYRLGVPEAGVWHEVLNTDAERYGGSNVGNGGAAFADGPEWDGQPHSLSLTLPPLSTLYLVAGRGR